MDTFVYIFGKKVYGTLDKLLIGRFLEFTFDLLFLVT